MILAAGKGTRMRPLTLTQPKPLLQVGDKSLIEHHLGRLAELGFKHVIINTAYLGEMIKNTLGTGQRFGLSINYSDESCSGALETAGGIINALPRIKSDMFIVVNGDIYSDYNFTNLLTPLDRLARLVLVDNPEHNPSGDFNLDCNGLATAATPNALNFTFSGIALFNKKFFNDLAVRKAALAPLLYAACANHSVEAIHYTGLWHDIGTPERLAQLNEDLSNV